MNAIEFAIEMENDAEQYYAEQAKISESKALQKVWLILAKDEKKHIEILENASKELFNKEPASELHTLKNSVFKDINETIKQRKDVHTQIDCYRIALGKEFESIDLYTNMLSQAKSKAEENIFEFLIGEEKQHYEFIDELIEWLTQSEERVESAEFGI